MRGHNYTSADRTAYPHPSGRTKRVPVEIQGSTGAIWAERVARASSPSQEVGSMAQTIRRFPALTLNTDGHAHPRENALVGLTAVLGLIAFITSYWHHLHILSSWTGLGGVITGLWGQFISVTTAERFV